MPDVLAAAQHWMLAAMTGDEPPPGACEHVAGSDSLPAERRVELYRRAYRSRLVGCLRETHPGLRHALGSEVFDAFALDYLEAHPSRSPNLAQLGAGWARHLEDTRPDRDAPRRETWPDFLVDLAHLERTFAEVYDGPGTEGEDILRPDDLPRRPPPAATIQPAPCLRLLHARVPFASYLAAVHRDEDPPLPAPAPSHLAVSRCDWVVSLTELAPREHAALAAIVRGEALASAARIAGLRVAELWAYVAIWARRGFLRAIREPAGLSPSEAVS